MEKNKLIAIISGSIVAAISIAGVISAILITNKKKLT